jgi:hypothetical protein
MGVRLGSQLCPHGTWHKIWQRGRLAARGARAAAGAAGDRAGTDRVRCWRFRHIYNNSPDGIVFMLRSRSYPSDRRGS